MWSIYRVMSFPTILNDPHPNFKVTVFLKGECLKTVHLILSKLQMQIIHLINIQCNVSLTRGASATAQSLVLMRCGGEVFCQAAHVTGRYVVEWIVKDVYVCGWVNWIVVSSVSGIRRDDRMIDDGVYCSRYDDVGGVLAWASITSWTGGHDPH